MTITVPGVLAMDWTEFSDLICDHLGPGSTEPWPVLFHDEVIDRTYTFLAGRRRAVQNQIDRGHKPPHTLRFLDYVLLRLDQLRDAAILLDRPVPVPCWQDDYNRDRLAELTELVMQQRSACLNGTEKAARAKDDELWACADEIKMALPDGTLVRVINQGTPEPAAA